MMRSGGADAAPKRTDEEHEVTDREHDTVVQRTTVFGAVKRSWWLVLGAIILFLILGAFFAINQGDSYVASSELILTDSQAPTFFPVTDLLGPSNQDSERYLADQVEILRSSEVAETASELLDGEYSGDTIIRRRTVLGDLTSNRIVITFDSTDPEAAKRGADALAMAYTVVRLEQVQDAATAALATIDDLLQNVDERLGVFGSQIDEIQSGDAARQGLRSELAAARVRLTALRVARDQAPLDGLERASLNAQIDELFRDVQALEVFARLEDPDVALAALLAEQAAAVAERAALVTRRNSIAVDTEIATGGVALFSPAPVPETPMGLPLQLILIVAALLGLALGAAIAYGRALRQTEFEEKDEPEKLLQAPMIGEVPSPRSNDPQTALPMVDSASTPSAEAYRFIAAAIATQQDRARTAGAEPANVLAVVGAEAEDGSSMVAANTAIAFAEAGKRVLIIDADVDSRTSTRLLVPGRNPRGGLDDIVASGFQAASSIIQVDDGHAAAVDLLTADASGSTAPSVFRDPRMQAAMARLRADYDLVLIDSPPLLGVAYSRWVLDLADAALAVVGHGTPAATAREFHDQIVLADVPVVGYVYNRSLNTPGTVRDTSI